MNHIEIYYLCNSNSEDECCLDEEIEENYCRQCKTLKKFNLLFEKMEKERSFKLINLIDKLIDFLFKHKYHLLPQLREKKCDLDHERIQT